jgi:septal ring factor EnvC (AmiA/AmiB activator)
MTKARKRSLLRALGTSYAKGTDLAALLWLQGNETEAQSVERRNRELRSEIDALRRELWRDWRGNAESLESQVRNLNRKLQARIRQIERRVEAAQHLVRGLDLLDELIELSRSLTI